MEPLNRIQKLAVFIYLLVWFVGSLWGMAALGSLEPSGRRLGINLELYRNYAIFGFAGVTGGTLYSLRMFHQYYEELTTRWLYWHFMRPFLCFGSASITIILFESGVLLLTINDSLSARIGIAFLAGFGYGKFFQKIQNLTETFFNESKKDNKP